MTNTNAISSGISSENSKQNARVVCLTKTQPISQTMILLCEQ